MRDALEKLIFLGSVEETFKLLGKDWTIRTLAAEEQLAATSGTAEFDTLARVNAIRIRVLSHALKKIDDVELKDSDETYEFLIKLQQPVINALFSRYENLLAKQDDALRNLDEIKN